MTSTAAQRRRTAGADDGFTLLEVMVAFVVFAIVAVGAMAAIVSSLKASHRSQQVVDAANVAQSFIAAAQANPAAAQAESGQQYPATLKNEHFVVLRTVAFRTPGATRCSAGLSFRVSVVVYQAQAYAARPSTGELARSDSLITC